MNGLTTGGPHSSQRGVGLQFRAPVRAPSASMLTGDKGSEAAQITGYLTRCNKALCTQENDSSNENSLASEPASRVLIS